MIPRPVTIDFETEAIAPRPAYPPRPVGVGIKYPGRTGRYWAWGHPTENNCTREEARRAVKEAYRWPDGVVCQHAKFDCDVAATHLGLSIGGERVDDTKYLLFLNDPYALDLSLKSNAERLLKIPPEERDLLREWLVVNIPEARRKPTSWGAYICRAPGKLVGTYCKGDLVRTEALFEHLYPRIAERGMLAAYDRERRLMPILLENERQGVRVNLPALERDCARYEEALKAADAWLRTRLRTKDLNVDSDRELAEALDRARVVTEWKYTQGRKNKLTGAYENQQRSVSKRNLTLEMFLDKRVAAVLGYRNRLSTCLGTFMQNIIAQARETDGWFHADWNQVRDASGGGARTGRMSVSLLHNMAKKFGTKRDAAFGPYLEIVRTLLPALPPLPALRSYFLPDTPNGVWLRRDYNQQEVRILAHYEDGALLRSFQADPYYDLHDYVQRGVREITGFDLNRDVIKNGINFPEIYGSGVRGMMETMASYGLQFSAEQCKAIKKAKELLTPDVKALMDAIKERGHAGQAIRTWGGREYYCEPARYLESEDRVVDFAYKLTNYLIQGSAGDCTKESIINYHDHPRRQGRWLLSVHDENDCSAPDKRIAKQEMQVLREAMEDVKFDLPMLSDGEQGPNWGTLEKVKER